MATVTQYFESLRGYSVPMLPKHPISADDAKRRRAYYEAEFDEFGRIVRVTKVLDAQFELRHDYQYDASGRLSGAQVTGADGSSREIELSPVTHGATRLRA